MFAERLSLGLAHDVDAGRNCAGMVRVNIINVDQDSLTNMAVSLG
jgi:hypothetical protein